MKFLLEFLETDNKFLRNSIYNLPNGDKVDHEPLASMPGHVFLVALLLSAMVLCLFSMFTEACFFTETDCNPH